MGGEVGAVVKLMSAFSGSDMRTRNSERLSPGDILQVPNSMSMFTNDKVGSGNAS
jgi:hypothetical protein